MSYEEISASEALALTADAVWRAAGGILLDVREQHEWDRGHSTAAVHIPMSALGERLEELPAAPILVVCHAGGRSARVAAALAELGHDAINVAGGMLEWPRLGGELAAAGDAEPAID